MIDLYHGDCLDILLSIESKSVDLIFADLPYGTTQNNWDAQLPMNDYIVVDGKRLKKDEFLLYGFKHGTSYSAAVREFNKNKKAGLWTHYKRIIKDNGVILLWAQSPFDKYLAMSNPKMYRYEWIIEKTNSTGHLNANKMPMKAHENILVFYKKLPYYYPQKTSGHKPINAYIKHKDDGDNYNTTKTGIAGGGNTDRFPRDILKFSWDTQKSSLHPTQKPVDVIKYFLKTYTKPGDVILDNCMGSGSTGVACVELGRSFVGIELDNDYYKTASERIHTAAFPKGGLANNLL